MDVIGSKLTYSGLGTSVEMSLKLTKYSTEVLGERQRLCALAFFVFILL